MIRNNTNMKKYFSYDPESGLELHATAEEARVYAEGNLDLERDAAGEGWSDGVDQICWGELRQHTVETMSRPRTEEDLFVSSDCDTIVDYGLVDVGNRPIPSNFTLEEALKEVEIPPEIVERIEAMVNMVIDLRNSLDSLISQVGDLEYDVEKLEEENNNLRAMR